MNAAAETARIVSDAQEGSHDAFMQLVRQHQGIVRTFLRRFVSEADSADDLAQEVFVAAFRKISEYRGEATFATWLLAIARNLALHHLRCETRRRQRDTAAAIAGWRSHQLEQDPGDALDHELTLTALRECLDGLPHDSRRIVHQFYFEQQTAGAIADQLGKNAGAVRMMLMRIRGDLGDCVQSKLARRGNEP